MDARCAFGAAFSASCHASFIVFTHAEANMRFGWPTGITDQAPRCVCSGPGPLLQRSLVSSFGPHLLSLHSLPRSPTASGRRVTTTRSSELTPILPFFAIGRLFFFTVKVETTSNIFRLPDARSGRCLQMEQEFSYLRSAVDQIWGRSRPLSRRLVQLSDPSVSHSVRQSVHRHPRTSSTRSGCLSFIQA